MKLDTTIKCSGHWRRHKWVANGSTISEGRYIVEIRCKRCKKIRNPKCTTIPGLK